MGWNSIPPASRALATAPRKSKSIPMTSPVDFISGPRYVSTPASLDIENTGAFTATKFCRFPRPPLYPISARVLPSIILVASFTIGNTGDLGEEGHCATGAGIHLQNVHRRLAAGFRHGLWTTIGAAAYDHVLDIHQSLHFQGNPYACRMLNEGVDLLIGEGHTGVYRHRVAAVHSPPSQRAPLCQV